MLKRMLGSRGLMSATVVLTLVLAAAIGLRISKPEVPTRSYCAEMPDSIGLYKGSAVAILGIPVGRVTEITPDGPTARVRFTVRADRKLPPDVGAVTVSDTLVADRTLTLIGAEPTGPAWNPDTCITKTLTPKSLTQTFEALTGLVDGLNGGGDPAKRTAVAGGIDALDTATNGTGDQINALIKQLSTALTAPDAAIGHLGKLLDALTELAHRARNGWTGVQSTVIGLPQAFSDIVTLAFPPVISLVAALTDTLPQANDAIMMLAAPMLKKLDVPNLARLIASGVGSLIEVIRMTPAVATGFATALDPTTGQLTIGYSPPKIALGQADSDSVCAAVQALTGQGCTVSGGVATIPAVPALLAAVSAR
ncbi:MCE family protein [Nocardia sp. ET3-3]|uniref:MCE family protein n=1 Tax=Nocardia terrae TaxID=2675851 RepID=A0A7K1US29_9NOCA|nr:MlaD family protein [Nocardia terrae]MVU76708.1 MCE family protein [Nocardia terrae]